MKILQLCKKFPYPLKDGESIAVTYLSKALNQLGCKMTLLTMNTKKHYFNINELPDNYDHYQSIHFTDVNNEVKPFDAFLNLFSEDSYHISRFISPEFELKLIALLKSNHFDIVQIETVHLAPYIPIIRQYSDAKIAMRAHNVEFEIWQRIADNTRFFPKKWYLNHLTKKLKRYEVGQLKQYDMMVAITQRDLDFFKKLGYKNKGIATPIGLDISDYEPNYKTFNQELSLSFIGALDWMPNYEGLMWFLENVWQQLSERFPNLKFHIAGRHTPDSLMNLKMKNVKVYGEIPDANQFINAHSIMVVPLLSGGGMRAKILEGMALGKVILSTTLGLEGIEAQHEKEVFIADTPKEIIENISFAIQNKKHLLRMGQNARSFVTENFDNLNIARRLEKEYRKMKMGKLTRNDVMI
ncbi:MAG TPA: glycosyltransferase [Phaeodactylibacter sp.]|nr:glycosyltransferase [Phaeodactylibacter sp.]